MRAARPGSGDGGGAGATGSRGGATAIDHLPAGSGDERRPATAEEPAAPAGGRHAPAAADDAPGTADRRTSPAGCDAGLGGDAPAGGATAIELRRRPATSRTRTSPSRSPSSTRRRSSTPAPTRADLIPPGCRRRQRECTAVVSRTGRTAGARARPRRAAAATRSRRWRRSRTPRRPGRVRARAAGRTPAGRPRAAAPRRAPAPPSAGPGLPVDDGEPAVVAAEDRVDPAADGDAVDDRLDRGLDRLGDAVGPLAGEEALLHQRQVAVVAGVLVGAAGQVEQVDHGGLGEVLLDPGVEGGAPSGGDGGRRRHRAAQRRARRPRGHGRAPRPRTPTGAGARSPRRRCDGCGPALAQQQLDLAGPAGEVVRDLAGGGSLPRGPSPLPGSSASGVRRGPRCRASDRLDGLAEGGAAAGEVVDRPLPRDRFGLRGLAALPPSSGSGSGGEWLGDQVELVVVEQLGQEAGRSASGVDASAHTGRGEQQRGTGPGERDVGQPALLLDAVLAARRGRTGRSRPPAP